MAQIAGAATNDMFKPPAQDTMVDVMDNEMAPPPQRVMESPGVHLAGPAKYVSDGDQAYSKCICYVCGIGEALGAIVCGDNCKCFCVSVEAVCGLGGEKGCPKGNAVCEMYPPTGDCGVQVKCCCLKYGVIAPWVEGKPWIVCCKKTVA